MHLRLFEHPDSQVLIGISRPALGVTGSLLSAKPSLAYEGRLTIVNAGGDCTVELLSGTLPRGATVSVDNATKQVVVAWPTYSEGGSAPFNGSFEQGAAGWELGPGWSVRNDHAGAQPGFDGTWDARYDGAGSALLMNAERRAVTAGQSVTASVQVEQGASSRSAAGAAVRLEWLSAGGAPVGTPAEGNMVDDASGGAVFASTVTSVAPTGAAFARLGARGFRRRQNSPLWIDDFAWSLVSPAVGTNVEGEYCISLRVTDALGRTADWAGCVLVTEDAAVYLAGSQNNGKIFTSLNGSAWSAADFVTITGGYSPNPLVQTLASISGVLYASVGNSSGGTQLLRSADNGASWSVVWTHPTIYVKSIRGVGDAIVANLNSSPVTGQTTVLRSLDNGLSFAEVAAYVGTAYGSHGSAAKGSAIMVGLTVGYVITSQDAGVTWNRYFYGGGTTDIVLATPTTFVSFGTVAGNFIQVSTDGTAASRVNADYPGRGSTVGGLVAGAYDAVHDVVVVLSGNGTVLRSLDRGYTWSLGTPIPSGEVGAGLAIGINGRVIVSDGATNNDLRMTEDGGLTWAVIAAIPGGSAVTFAAEGS